MTGAGTQGSARARLAEMLRRERAAAAAPAVPPTAPLSSGQGRLWFLHRLAGGGGSYSVVLGLRLLGSLSAPALGQALDEIQRRHEPLRTVFREDGAGPVQVVLSPSPVPLATDDLASLPEAERAPAMERLRREEAAAPFDLERGPILRARLCRLAPGEHELLVAVHHIAFDGWSIGVFMKEMAAFYDAFVAGRAADLPRPGLRYADYARDRQARSGERRQAAALAYWRDRLRALPQAELPTDRPRSAVPASVEGGRLPLRLEPDLAASVEAAARLAATTPFVVLLTALQTLLHRLGAGQRVAVGSPIAGRDEAALEGLIGLFVNLLTLDIDFEGDPGFASLLGQGKATVLQAFRHQEAPIERVVEESAEGSRGRALPFRVAFALQAPPEPPRFETPGLVVADMTVETGNRFDLELYLWRSGAGYEGAWFYDAALFDRATVAALDRTFTVLLRAALADPDRAVSRLPLEGASAAAARGEGTVTVFPSRPIQEVVAEQASARPAATAVRHRGQDLSYGVLEARAAALAARLVEAGVRPGALVAVAGERSAALVTAFLAILKAGAAYLPLDPAHPAAVHAAMLADAGPVLLLNGCGSRIESPAGLPALDLEAELEAAATAAQPAVSLPLLPPEAPAYVNYTSGSTGIPKGIVVPHRAVVRLVRETDYIRLGPGDRVLHASNTAFDAATFEIWGALANGATLVVADRESLLDPEGYAALLGAEAITALFVTTALFNRVAERCPAAFSDVSTLLFGGEAADPGACRRVLEAGPPGRLVNVYGPTETTTFALWQEVTLEECRRERLPIGRPLANGSALLLDVDLQPLPEVLPGELWLGGAGLAHGYLGQPALTADRFRPDPFSGRPGARLYRSGDRGCRRADGAIEFLGRIDRQVKVRGFRVEPGEIEAQLRSLSGVVDAAVLPRREAEGTWRLEAYVAAPALPDPMELRRQLAARLPDYKLPAALVVLESLPLGPTGKLDRAALPPASAAEPAGEAKAENSAGPADALEEQVGGIFSGLLERAQVGRHDSFFELGGHSLLATSLVSRLRDAFDVELPLAEVFARPSVAELAAAVRALQAGEKAASGAPPLQRADRSQSLPLSFAQSRLWFLDQLGLCGAAYHSPVNLVLRGRPDIAALRRALDVLVERHEALRTLYAEQDGQPVQLVLPPAPLAVEEVDLSALPPGPQRRALRRTVDAENARPFDLRADRPLRALLVRLSDSEVVLAATFHHIAFDGSSLAVFLREFELLYRCALGEADAQPPALPLQYADFAVWQRGWLDPARCEAEIAHWRARLEDVPPLELPGDRPRPLVETFRGGHLAVKLPPALASAVRDLARRNGTTVFVPLLAAFQALLHRYSGQPRFAVGSPIANRTRSELEGLIGFFVNTLVLDADFSGDPSFEALLERTRGRVLEAFDHQDLPFEMLVEALQPERTLGHNPLFQVVFALQPQAALAPRLALPELEVRYLDLGVETVRFDLELHLWEDGEGFSGYLFFNGDLFDAETARRWVGHYSALLEAALAAPERPLSSLELVSHDELLQLEAWSSA